MATVKRVAVTNRKLYELDDAARTARFLGAAPTFAFALADRAEYIADGEDMLGLRLTTGTPGRIYLVTLPTCDYCCEPFERDDGGLRDGDRAVFCDESCRDMWRMTR